MPRFLPSKLPDVVNFLAFPLLIAMVSWGGWNAFDVRERIVRLETEMADIKGEIADIKSAVDRIGINTAPHDGRMADGGNRDQK